EQPERSHERQRAIQEMILADNKEARVKALDKLLPFQRRDFVGIFQAMDGFPVTIRLIDPPLHEFVPHERGKQEELAAELNIDVQTVVRRVEQLHEANPMLGHRGCRLAITYPEILEMQVRAIIEAALECQKGGVKVLPEIMHPLTLDRKELSILEQASQTRPQLKISICGEHGGDADSVKFCHQVGMDYVSASPFRVPIARLAAAQVVVEEKRAKKTRSRQPGN